MKGWIGHPGWLVVCCPSVTIKHLVGVHFEVGWHRNAVYNVFGAIWRGLAGSISRSVGTGMQYIMYLVPLGEGWQGPFRGRLAPECIFCATWRWLAGSKWRMIWCGQVVLSSAELPFRNHGHPSRGRVGSLSEKGWASPVPSQALKPPGAPRLETTTPSVARGGFMLIGRKLLV